MSRMLQHRRRLFLGLLVVATAAGVSGLVAVATRPTTTFVQRATIGDLEVIHARVSNNGVAQFGTARLAMGDRVATAAAGRAQLRLADGASALLDSNSELIVNAGRLELKRGRLFVNTPLGNSLRVTSGSIEANVSSSKVAFERKADGDQTRLFCAQGEVMVSHAGTTTRVPSGETLTTAAGKLSVAAEKAFDDWTGGLAVPWSDKVLTRSAIAEVWIADAQGDPNRDLHVSNQEIDVTLHGEFALTHTRSRYYNGNDITVTPEVRVALPPNAVLTRVAYRPSAYTRSHEGTLEVCNQETSSTTPPPRLEWAGNGWISGTLPAVPAGSSIDLELDWGEWLTVKAGAVSYRYPFGQADQAPTIGELSVRIDAQDTGADAIEANHGASVDGKKLAWRTADQKPSDDWVVSYAPTVAKPNVVRAYVERATDNGDPYVLFRTETAAQSAAGIVLSIVVDSSRSMGTAGLELARQVIGALLSNLSETDRVVVFAANEEQRPVLTGTPSPNQPALRERILAELGQIRPGGASDLGRALERAADALDTADLPTANRLVVYLGDGRPSLGELSADRIRTQLQRRAQGIPRIAGVALGPNADRWLLARLVSGSGPVHSVLDRSEAAKVASSIVAAAEEATQREVLFDLGTNVDRIYPREARAVPRGSTAMVIGRLRGTLPRTVKLSYRDESGAQSETRRVEQFGSPWMGELGRRWALARIQEIVAGSEGIEPALLLARQHHLLTPFTDWVLDPSQQDVRVSCSPFSRRIVELSTLNDSPYARRIEGPSPSGAGWLEPPLQYDPGDSMEQGAKISGKARIVAARAALLGCRDARIQIVANLPDAIDYRVALRGNGSVERVALTPNGSGRSDAVFFGCIERVIRSLPFVGAERPIDFNGTVTLPPPRDPRRSQCSVTSRLPLLVRRTVWAKRSGDPLVVYEEALRGCETTTWAERRSLLLELVGTSMSAARILELAQGLVDRGHADAALYLQSEAMRRVSTLDELKELRRQILSSEPNLDADLAARVRRTTGDGNRLAVVQRALSIAPHSPLGRRLELLLLERMADKAGILRAVEMLRNDPFTDAGLVAMSATILGRLDQKADAQRAFSELFERAPRDPWVLAFAGDQLRIAGFGEQAILAYDSLAAAVPNDTTNLLRSGLAAANVGRIDISTRLLDRAAQMSGRSDDSRLNELGAVLRAVILGRAQSAAKDPNERLELGRRLAQTALPDVSAILLVEAPTNFEQGLIVRTYRGEDRLASAPDLDASPLGIAAMFVDRGAPTIKLEVSRKTLAGLAPAMPVTVTVLRLGDNPNDRQLATRMLSIPTDQETAAMTLRAELRP